MWSGHIFPFFFQCFFALNSLLYLQQYFFSLRYTFCFSTFSRIAWLTLSSTIFVLCQVERKFSECSSSLNWNKERVRELEMKLSSLQEVSFVLFDLKIWFLLHFFFISSPNVILFVEWTGILLIQRCSCSQWGAIFCWTFHSEFMKSISLNCVCTFCMHTYCLAFAPGYASLLFIGDSENILGWTGFSQHSCKPISNSFMCL